MADSSKVTPAQKLQTATVDKAELRTVIVGDPETGAKFKHNGIKTSKYTWWNFLPKNLFMQFRLISNIYFLIMVILMVIGETKVVFISTIASYSTILPLLLVLGTNMLLEIFDDVQRCLKDRATNNKRTARVISGGRKDRRPWKDIRVGDLILLKSDEAVPADLVLLGSSNEEGICYVETMNIDGETNLKIRNARKDIMNLCITNVPNIPSDELMSDTIKDLKDFRASVECELPNKNIHTFEGALSVEKSSLSSIDNPVPSPLGPHQLLLRGSTIRNTKWVLGAVVYTGAETKVMLNSRQTPTKMGSVQHMMNKMLLVVAAVFFALVIVSATGATIFVNSNEPWYISLVNQTKDREGGEQNRCGTIALCGSPALDWIGFFLTFIVLYNNSVPISLMVTVEAINMVQGILIGKDVEMYYDKNNTPAVTRSSSLAQEIGQIEYIFSDKTGTLTCNKMEFKCAYIDGKVYGSAEANEFDNTEYLRDVEESTDEKKKEALNLFRIVLGVAHTIVAETNEKTGEIEYQAESPDEAALVSAAKDMQCTFVRRNNQSIFVNDKNGEEQVYHIYGINQFNSTRKRMSVVVGAPDGRYLLLCKGADNVICERAVQDASSEQLAQQLHTFAEQGLRTLVIAYRELSHEAATQWAQDFHAAEVSMTDRAKLHDEVAEKIEKDLVIVGATAIEDKLQDGVPQCIADLREASIKLWVLTGDKLETAINIGYSSRVLSQEMALITIKELEDIDNGAQESRLRRLLWQVSKKLGIESDYKQDKNSFDHPADDDMLGQLESDLKTHPDGGKGLVVTGAALTFILADEGIKHQFLSLAKACNVLIACRASPLQKSLVITMVRSGIKPEPITLAIGDGANDVAMIQTAHIGVGISGEEGMQAANNSDFAFAQFRFLKQLLLVHGHWNYRRIAIVILYSFYKNLALVFTSFFFVLYTAWSGAPLYEGFLGASFNIFLATPILLTGIFNKDVLAETSFARPSLYVFGHQKMDLNPMKMFRVIIFALIDSVIIFFFPFLCVVGTGSSMATLPVFGMAAFTYLIVVAQIKVLFLTNAWNVVSLVNWVLMIVGYLLFLVLLSNWLFLSTVSHAAFSSMITDKFFYVNLFGVIAATSAVEVAVSYFERRLFYDKMDAELRAAQGCSDVSNTPISPKVAPSKAEAVVPQCSLQQSDSADSTATNEPQDSNQNESTKASELDSESDSNSVAARLRLGTVSDGEVVKPAQITSKKSVDGPPKKYRSPKKYGSFQRHNSKTNGFAFAHPEGGDIRQRNLSFIGIRHAVHAFDKSGVVEIEEKEEKVSEAKRRRNEPSLDRTITTVQADEKNLRPKTEGAVGKFMQQSLPSKRFRPYSPLFAGPLLLICGLVLTILGALMFVGLGGKVEYIIQYDGVPMNPFTQSEPSPTTWSAGDDAGPLKAGFSKHRNMYYSYQKCEASAYKPAGLPKKASTPCNLAFYIDEPVPNAVLRYRIDNMYYGDARFYLSFSPKQIQYGLSKSDDFPTEKVLNLEKPADGSCNGGVWTGLNGVKGGQRGIGVPCGNRAHAMFNDKFSAQLVRQSSNNEDAAPDAAAAAAAATTPTAQQLVMNASANASAVLSGAQLVRQSSNNEDAAPDAAAAATPTAQQLVMNASAVLSGADFMYTNTKGYDEAIKNGKELPKGFTYLYQMHPNVVDKKKGMEDPHFRVWMRIEAFPTFQKPYAKFTEPTDGFVKDDVVVISVTSQYDVASFNGTKYVVLAAESVGGAAGLLPVSNIGAPLSFLVPGILFIILGMLVFLVKCFREDDDTPKGKLKVNAGCFCREYKNPCRHKDDAE